MTTSDNNDPLMQRAAALPRNLEPGRDLWPEIAAKLQPATARVTPQRTRFWPAAIAAGIGLVVLSSSLTWWVATHRDVSAAEIVAAISDMQTLPSHTPDAGLLLAREDMIASLEQSLERLPPATRRVVGSNLLEIHRSLGEIRLALLEDPENAFLHQLLYATYEQELGLLSDINRMAMILPNEIQT